MRFLLRSLTGLFLLAATLGILATAGFIAYGALQERLARETTPRTARERVFVVNVVRFEPGTVAPHLTSFGELRSRRTLEIRTSAGGTIVELADGFEEGGRVERGQLLLRVDPTDFTASLDLARTDLLEAQADKADAKAALILARDDLVSAQNQAALRAAALARQQDLVARGVGTEAAVETAALAAASADQAVLSRRQALASAETRVAQAENTLARRAIAVDEAKRRLAETELYAEFSGTLSEVTAIEGGLVTQNERVAQLIDPAALEVSFRVSTAQYARLLDSEGGLIPATVEVELDVAGVNLVAHGRIDRESAAVGEGQTGRLLFARLEDAKGFRPGDFVTVVIEEPPLDNVAVLPASALDAGNRVLVVNDDDRLEEVEVTLLRRQGDDVLVRARGLTGHEVVAERSPVLGAGIKVRAARPAGDADAAQTPAEPQTVKLSPEKRAALIAFVEGNQFMPDDAKARILNALEQDEVPVSMVERLESRMGG